MFHNDRGEPMTGERRIRTTDPHWVPVRGKRNTYRIRRRFPWRALLLILAVSAVLLYLGSR